MSLVELITVIAIMSILIGAAGYGMSLVSGKPAEECAQGLVSTIEHARTASMGKNMTTITIRGGADGVKVEETVRASDDAASHPLVEKKAGKKGVSIAFSTAAEDGSLSLSFDRASGALKYVNGAEPPQTVEIHIEKAGTKRKIVIYSLTGKVSLEAE